MDAWKDASLPEKPLLAGRIGQSGRHGLRTLLDIRHWRRWRQCRIYAIDGVLNSLYHGVSVALRQAILGPLCTHGLPQSASAQQEATSRIVDPDMMISESHGG